MYDDQLDDLIDWLYKKAKSFEIKVLIGYNWDSDWPSQADTQNKIIFYNPNWLPKNERPFTLAHEIGHVIAQSPNYNTLNSRCFNQKIESEANLIAIQLILEYIKLNDLSFETEEQIAETFAIPDSMISDLNKAIQLTSMDSRTRYSSQLYNDGRFLF